MRRDRTLITEYLRRHDPVDGGAALRRRPAPDAPAIPAAPAKRPARRFALASGAAALALAVVAIVVAAVLPSGRSAPGGLLSPEAAVAAASQTLEGDGILVWTELQGYSAAMERTRGRDGRCDCWMESTTIVDLKTGERRIDMTSHGWTKAGEPKVTFSTQWVNGNGNWVIGGLPNKPSPDAEWRLAGGEEKDDRGRVAVEHLTFGVGDGNDAHRRRTRARVLERNNPIEQVRETLRQAQADEAEIREGAPDGGTPTIEIIRRKPWMTSRTWITNERVPRLIRTTIDTRCPSGRPCDRTPGDGKGSTIHDETRTTRWTISPRSDELLATVKRPVFDRQHYVVHHMDFGNLVTEKPRRRR